MHHVVHPILRERYIDALVGCVLHDIAISRWTYIHEGKWLGDDFDQKMFVSHFGFIVDWREFEPTRRDYETVMQFIREHWARLSYPDIRHPPSFEIIGRFYVIEIIFEASRTDRVLG